VGRKGLDPLKFLDRPTPRRDLEALHERTAARGPAAGERNPVRLTPAATSNRDRPVTRWVAVLLPTGFVSQGCVSTSGSPYPGRGPYPLILDSGAGRTVLDPSVLEAVGAGRTLDSLRVGEFEAHGLGVSPLEMTDLSRALREPVVGIVGHPVFADGPITYDYPRGQIRLSRAPLVPGDPGVVPARGSSRPWVVGEVDGKRFWVLLDTGSSRGLSLADLES
jgi:hypothetical protein